MKKVTQKQKIALLSTGALVGIGVGIAGIKKCIKAQQEARRHARSLQELEDENFED